MPIEDDDDLAELIERGLSEKGMRVTHVRDSCLVETVRGAGYRFAS